MSEHGHHDSGMEHSERTPGQAMREFLGRGDVRMTIGFGVIITIAVALIGIFLFPDLMMRPLSPDMRHTIQLVSLFTVLSAPVAGVVLGVTVYAIRSRHRGSEPPEEGPAIRENKRVVTIWVAASSLLCTVAVVIGLAEMSSAQAAATGEATQALQVQVTGSQWAWNFTYPQYGISTTDLNLPLNRPVDFTVVSTDVTNSFWPVQLGIKVDANAWAPTTIETVPDTIGHIDIRCAELCGLYHAYMQANGEVMKTADFNNWVTSQGGHV